MKKIFITLLALVLAIGILIPLAAPSMAAVTTYEGFTSRNSSISTGGETLQLLIDSTPAGGTLNLDQDYTGSKGSWGYGESVLIKKAITITGPASNDRVKLDWIQFIILADNVTLKNLRFEKSGQPHGMFIETREDDTKVPNIKNLTIKNCVFDTEDNKAVLSGKRSAYSGGSVYLKNCDGLIFTNCKFLYNRATFYGGSVYLENISNCTFTGCSFNNNEALSTGGQNGTAAGGCIYAKNSNHIDLNECTFEDNFAEQYGGAAYFNKSDYVDISDCTFSGNNSTPSYSAVYDAYGMGGALAFNKSYHGTVKSCNFNENKAYMGAGIYANNSNLTVQSDSFTNNVVNTKVVINPNLIRRVVGTLLTIGHLDVGDIIQHIETYILTEVTCPGLLLHKFTNGTGKIGGEGGGIYALDSVLKVNDGEFTGNQADKMGAGIYTLGGNAKTTQISTSVFMNNTAQSAGGAIANLMTGAAISDCQIQGNKAGVGGGIYSVAECSVTGTKFISNNAEAGGAVCANVINNEQTYSDCSFSNNSASAGGAIHAHGADKDGDGNSVKVKNCKLTVDNCEFTQNASVNYGGALSFYRIKASVKNSTFGSNSTDGQGGALYNNYSSNTTFNKCVFNKNNSDKGGAVYNNQSRLSLSRSEFNKNTAGTGGAVLDNGGRTAAENCLFTGNKGMLEASVLMLNGTNDCSIVNCTIANNLLKPVYAENFANLNIENSIIVSNSVAGTVSGQDVRWTNDSNVNVSYSICAETGPGDEKGTVDIFDDSESGDYHLRYNFTSGYMGAMEKGDNSAVSQNKDLDGNRRIIDNDGDGNAVVDLGCYEQQYIRITYYIDSGKGKLDGKTVQWIPRGESPDFSAVTVTPSDGWVFDHWENSEGTIIKTTDTFKSGATIYAICTHKKVKVTYQYDPNKLKIASAPDGNKVSVDENTAQFITKVNQYSTPDKPTMKGINGWAFTYWTPDPDSVSQDTVMVASASPTATYDFGTGGYYDDGEKTAVWTTDMCNPLNSPDNGNIKTNPGYTFKGWSDTKGGDVIALPANITEPETYYAVYVIAKASLTVDANGGTLTTDPSGDYNYGTKLDLLNSSVINITPPAGNFLIGYTDGEGDAVDLNQLTLTKGITITAQYAAVPAGDLTIKTAVEDGIIKLASAEGMGFAGTTAQVVKTGPSGKEDILSLIIIQGHTDFAGFAAETSGNDMTLTAVYTKPLIQLVFTSTTSASNQFTYTVTGISPASGSAAGGTTVTVTGSGFYGGGSSPAVSAVNFGSTAGTSVTVASDTSLTVTSPAGNAGTVDVTVTTPGGTSATSANDKFTYIAAPTVTAISPTSGPAAGGTSITITGTGFDTSGTVTVSIGGNPATSVTVVSATSITATTPSGTPGEADVVVTNPDSQSATLTGGFTYIAAPVVSSISPTSGPAAGGTSVTITGTGFAGATAVDFGTNSASFTSNSDTQLTATAPAGTGFSDITVTTPGGTSATGNELDQFIYIPAPAVSSISPTSGPATGGTSVTITGTNLSGATAVDFGTNSASFTSNSDTQLTATAPAGTGTVGVTVTTAGGTSAVSSAEFTYIPATTVSSISPTSGPEAGGTTVTITGPVDVTVTTPGGTSVNDKFSNTFNTYTPVSYTRAIQRPLLRLEPAILQSHFITPSTGGSVDFSSFGYFEYGTVIDLSTVPVFPDPGYRFVGWKDGDGKFVTSVTLTADTEIYAVFERITYTLTVEKSGTGSVDASLPGTYDSGESVLLDPAYATAGTGYTFAGYKDESGDYISTITMDADKTVTAVFIPDSCTIMLKSGNNGSIDDTAFIRRDYGTVIDLNDIECTPDEDYQFSHWKNESGQTVSSSYTVQGDQTLTAIFEPVTYMLSVVCPGGGSVSGGLAGEYSQGSIVPLDAGYTNADSGYMFEGFVDSEGNPISSVTMDADKTVTAVFSTQQYTLSIRCMKTDGSAQFYSVQWYPAGTEINLSDISISVSGYKVKGWQDGDQNSIASVVIDEDKTVYALIEAVGSSYVPPVTTVPLSIDVNGTQSSTTLSTSGKISTNVAVSSPDNKVNLDIPSGTAILTSSGTAPIYPTSIIVLPDTFAPQPPPGDNIIGIPYSCLPGGLHFNPAVTLTWKLGNLPAGVSAADLEVAFYDTTSRTWVAVPSTYDPANGSVVATISHFTDYAVINTAVSKTTTSVTTTTPTTTASVPVTTSTSSVPPTTSTMITTSSAPTTTSSLTTSVSLTSSNNTAQSSSAPWGLIIGIIAAVAVIIIVLLVVVRKRRE